jgi:hypothetical protein
MAHSSIPLVLGPILSQVGTALTSDLPRFRAENGAQQFVVHGKPFLILGGELGNSSAGTAAQADFIRHDMARMHLNTVLMPVAWEQTDPTEGHFDFDVVDHWIDVARQQNLVSARLNGDQGNQGRQLTMDPREIRPIVYGCTARLNDCALRLFASASTLELLDGLYSRSTAFGASRRP